MLKNQLLYYNFSIDVRNVLENIRRLLISKISTFYIYIYKDYKDYLYVLYIHTYIHNMIYIICNIIYIYYIIYIYIYIYVYSMQTLSIPVNAKKGEGGDS